MSVKGGKRMRYQTITILVLIGVVGCGMTLAQSPQDAPDSETAAAEAAEAPGKVSGKKKAIPGPWEPGLGVVVSSVIGYDSNPLVLDDDLPEADGVVQAVAGFSADVRMQRTFDLPKFDKKDRIDPQRFLDLGFGVSASDVWQDGLSSIAPLDVSWRVYFDRDVFVCDSCYSDPEVRAQHGLPEKARALKRLSVGVLAAGLSTDLDDRPFSSTIRALPAMRFTWKSRYHCELDNLLIYYRYDDHRDQEDPLDVFNRSGRYEAVGFEQTFFEGEGPSCRRRGPFLRLSPDSLWRLSFGYEYESRPTDGTEFDTHRNRVQVAFQHPLGENRKWLVDSSVQRLSAHYGPSRFDGTHARTDDESRLSLVFRHRFRQKKDGGKNDAKWLPKLIDEFELSIGAVVTRHDSSVPVYDYDRSYVFIGVKAALKGGTLTGIPEGGGTSTQPIGGNPGGEPPLIPGDPDAGESP
jgi:hypothetical protein